MPDAIHIDSIVKRFGDKVALNGVSLSAAAGQIYGFLGPNGAGKTTTIRCLMDYLHPDAGNVKVFGQDAHVNAIAVKRDLGYMSADNHLYDSWSTAQHLAFCQKVWGNLPKAEELVRRLQLELNVPAKHLSTGNHQKLGLVLALAHNPKLAILDEPTRGLDPLLQHEIQNILTEYRAAGGTVFISSHNLAEVEQLCDQVGIIKDGQMVANKSMADIRAMKAHLVTITLDKPVDTKNFTVPNLTIIQAHPDQIIAKVQGDINPLLQLLAKHRVKDLEITHLPLEEVFMAYYRQN